MKKGREKKVSDGENRTKINETGSIPYGREAVKKAILDATENLLLKKTPDKITVREIAKAANIKHPLIHRHFGTKEAVIAATHARGIAKAERKIAGLKNLEGSVSAIFALAKENKFRHIAISKAMLEGVDPRDIPIEIPAMQGLLELVKKRCDESDSGNKFTPEIITAILAAAILGWFLYEPFVLVGTGQENKRKDEIHKTVVEFLEEMLRKLC